MSSLSCMARARAAALPFAALVALTGTANSQTLFYGHSCPGFSGSAPFLSASGQVVSGQPFTLNVSGNPNAIGALIVGLSDTNWSGLPLPLDLSFLSLPGCELFVSVDLQLSYGTDANGDASFSAVGGPVGNTFYAQLFEIDPDPTFTVTLGGMSAAVAINPLPPLSSSPGDLVINEVMYDPSFASDNDGEWVEIYNPTGSDIDIEYWSLADNADDTLILNGGNGVVVPSMGYATIGRSNDAAVNGGLTHTGTYGGVFLNNGGDLVALLDYMGTTLDSIDYGSAGFPDPSGATIELMVTAQDATSNDTGTNWEVSDCNIGGLPFNADKATPGHANDQCFTTPPPSGEKGDVIVTEIIQNPSAVGNSSGEWFEVYNTTGASIDIEGWTISDNDSDSHLIDNGGAGVVVAAGGFAVLGRNADTSTNGGVTVDYQYSGISLGNSADELVLTDSTGAEQDRVEYDNGSTFPDPNGASMSFDPAATQDAASNNDGSNWCEGSTLYGAGDTGTPGAANDACP